MVHILSLQVYQNISKKHQISNQTLRWEARKMTIRYKFLFFLTFYISWSFCFMKLKGASFSFPACSLCWLLKYSRADIENLKQVQATLSQNPNAIKNIYQNATTFPSHPGWTQTYWVTQNMIFLKLHLNIWLTRDTHPFSSC